MIIKLTDVRNDGAKPIEVYVNMQNVLTFNKSMNGKDTHVKLIGNAFLFVKETPEEIIDKMVPKMVTAKPIVPIDDNMDHAYGSDAKIIYGAR